MIAGVVRWCAARPGVVLVAALAVAAAGELARRGLAHDALADLSEPQIALVAEWMGHPAPDVARDVTRVLTRELRGVAGAAAVRGSSMAGMAYVDVVFEADALDAGRRAIADRLAGLRARLPADVRLQLGPVASSVDWVFEYALTDPSGRIALSALRKVQEDYFAPALTAIPGVAEVATVGAGTEQVMVDASDDQLRLRGLAFSDLAAALRSVGHGQLLPKRKLEAIPIGTSTPDRPAPRIGDVARVMLVDDMPDGLADLDDTSAVGGIVVIHRGADPAAVVAEVKAALARLRGQLPATVRLATVYDRTELVSRVEQTWTGALVEELGVVVLVLLAFLLHGRTALIPLATLPVVLCLTFAGMWLLGIPATVMSLGGIGIALGMAVDADIVALEACHRRLEHAPAGDGARRSALLAAAGTVSPAILTSLLITALSFLPVLGFTGETGRLLRPMALTKTLVVAAAALVTLTLAPALRARWLRGRVIPEAANPIVRGLVALYRPFVHFALARPALTLVTAGLAVLSCLPIAGRLGGEFLPAIDEGDLLFMPTTRPGVSPGDAAEQLAVQDRALRRLPEVDAVFGKVGRAGTATDPAPFSMAETVVHLRPQRAWPTHPRPRWYSSWAPAALQGVLRRWWPDTAPETLDELRDKLDRATRLPGWTSAWTAPVRARLDMTSTGIRAPVALRVVAADPARLEALGEALQTMAARLPGTRTAALESLGGERWPVFVPDPPALAQHQVDPALARATADLVLAGGQVGELVMSEPGRPYRVRLMLEGAGHGTVDLRDVTVRSATGQPVALGVLGRPAVVDRPAMLRTEDGETVAYVHIDLDSEVDVASYVERGRRALAQAQASGAIRLEPGERIEWAGQYPLLAAGEQRLRWIVPLVALSMLALLVLQLRSVTEALLVLVSVPFALVGSVWTLFLLHYHLSPAVWVGLLSTVGLAMQTGVVMVVYIDEAFHRRVREGRLRTRDDVIAAHAEGTVQRVRPKVMTIATMAAGLLPLLWADGAGAEVIRRVAAPMLGGLVTSGILTLEVLPVLYTLWRQAQLRRAHARGVSIAAVVGPPPPWARGER
ncbi:MAG TPA: efflux RND transporter permease subunit [Kofleriaceae bacterium]|nr:efflux RND transporter permease subunit [Kofleriaceae bacterium]